MARVNNLTNFLNDVATAIKQKLGDNTPIPASQFDTKISEIETGGNYQNKSITITTNGNYNLLPDTGYDAMDQVSITVNVPSQDLSEQTVTQPDVKRGKTFYNNSGQLTVGSGPNIVVNQEDITSEDFEMSDVDRSIITNSMRLYRNVLFGTKNNILYAQTQNNQLASVVLTVSTVSQLSLGMEGVYGENTLVLGVYSSTIANTLYLYKYDYTQNTLSFLTELVFENATYFTLNPFRNLVAVSSSAPIQEIYSVNNDFSLTQVYSNTLTTMAVVRWFSKYRLGIYNGTDGQPKYFVDYYENDTSALTTNTSYSSASSGRIMPIAISPNNRYAVYGCCLTQNGSSDDVSYHCVGYSYIYSCSVNANGVFTRGNSLLTIRSSYNNFQYGNESAVFVDDYTLVYFYVYSSTYNVYIYKLVNGTWKQMTTLSNYRRYSFFPTYEPIFYYNSDYKRVLTSGGKRVVSAYIDSNLYVTSFDTTADASKLLTGYSAAMGNSVVDGTMPNNGRLNYTPSTSQQSIPAGYTSGGTISAVTSAIDSNIRAENIKSGVTILGIEGTYDGGGEDTPPYTELVYIQSTGSQYIDTGIKVKSTLNIKTEFEVTDNGSAFQSVFGGDGGSSRNYRGLAFDINSEGRFNYNFYGNTLASVPSYLQRYDNMLIFESYYNSAMIISHNDKKSQAVTSTETTSFAYDDVYMYIFARCRDNTPICSTNLKLYYFKIWDNETLLGDFIPVEDENGQVCMYDKVNKTYFYNADSSQGDFIAGPIKNAGDYSYVKTFEMDNGDSADGYSPMVDVYSKGGNLSLLIIRNISSVDTLHVWFEGDEDTDMNIPPQSKSEYLYESDEPASNIDVTHMHNVSSFNWIQPT